MKSILQKKLCSISTYWSGLLRLLCTCIAVECQSAPKAYEIAVMVKNSAFQLEDLIYLYEPLQEQSVQCYLWPENYYYISFLT